MQSLLTRSSGETQEVHLLEFPVQVKQVTEQTKQFCPLLKVPLRQFERQVLLKNTKDVAHEVQVPEETQPEQLEGQEVQVFDVLSG